MGKDTAPPDLREADSEPLGGRAPADCEAHALADVVETADLQVDLAFFSYALYATCHVVAGLLVLGLATRHRRSPQGGRAAHGCGGGGARRRWRGGTEPYGADSLSSLLSLSSVGASSTAAIITSTAFGDASAFRC